MILNVKDLDEFKQQLAAAGDKLVVVDFTASWCGPCKQISPVFEEQHKLPDNSNVVFLTVDVDEADDVASNCGVSCMPTFAFYKNGTKVFEFSGAQKELLREKIKELK